MKDVILTLLLIFGVYAGFIGFTVIMIKAFFPLSSNEEFEKRKVAVKTIRL